MRQAYQKCITDMNLPVNTVIDILMRPVPKEIGMLSFIMTRDESGLNRFSPKF